jgi:hypothetical protein
VATHTRNRFSRAVSKLISNPHAPCCPGEKSCDRVDLSLAKPSCWIGFVKQPTALPKPAHPDDTLAKIVASKPLPRSGVAKKLWDQNELNEKANSAGAGHSWAYAAAIFARSTGDSAEALRYIEWMSRGCNKPWIFITNVVGAPAIDVDRVFAGRPFRESPRSIQSVEQFTRRLCNRIGSAL